VGEDRTASTRVSVYEAASALGVTVDAIRKRVARGTIPHQRDEKGRVWVILDTDQDAASKVQDTDQPQSDSTMLISRLEDEVRFLREELARKDAIMLRMAESIPQLEAPVSEASPVPSDTPTHASGEAQEPTERRERSWWRRMFGSG
jgi:hypothetical protein